jgi:2-polyprenyl-3-methyl-5-hydroxy-6-metoxy-1,4-benzoquinol methylase
MRHARTVARAEIDQLAMIRRLPSARIVDRLDFLAEVVTGRNVIHIGFADAGCRDMQAGAGTWLHERLAARTRSLIGLDVDEAGVDASRQAGFVAHVVDCRDPGAVAALGLEPADVVVAGEVIEHLDSPGTFLDAVEQLLVPDGSLVLTTPNASGLGNALAAFAGFEVNHPDHVALFSCCTLTALLERHGWSVLEVRTYVPRVKATARSGRARALRAVATVLRWLELAAGGLGRPFVADGLILVARRGPT